MDDASAGPDGNWVETFKGAVLASEYDAAAWMNSRLYTDRFDQATWFLIHEIGLTPKTMKVAGRRFAVVRQNFQYVRELTGGELVAIRSGFIAVGRKHLRFLHRMFDVEAGGLLASADCTGYLAGLDSGRTVELPDDAAAHARALTITQAEID